MALVNTKEMFKKAYDGGYAIGAFNINDMEIIQGIMSACAELKAPVILQVSSSARKYAHPAYLVKMVEAAVKENPDIPVALHLDHGPSFEMCKACIDDGFTSVMFDGSAKPYEENVEEARRVVEYAHKYNVTVEAELGKLALELRRPDAVLFGELGVRVERVLFVHHFDEALVPQHDRAQHRLEIVLVLILCKDGHTLVFAERHFALVGLDLAREHLQKGGLARAVGADDAVAVAAREFEIDVLEQLLAAVLQADARDL